MDPNYRASEQQWSRIKGMGIRHRFPGPECLLELRARIESLEEGSTEQAESNRFCTDAIVARIEALEAAQQPDQIAPEPHRWYRLSQREPLDGDRCAYRVAPRFTKELGTWSSDYRRFWAFDKGLFYGEPDLISWRLAMPHELFPDQPAPATEESSATAPNAAIFPVMYADSDGDGIRILMEPADETGRVCWVVRNSRHVNPCHEFSSPEDAYAAHRRGQPATAPPAPAVGLVERVADVIYRNGPWRDRHEDARAAIREVAAWLRSEPWVGRAAADRLEQEASQ